MKQATLGADQPPRGSGPAPVPTDDVETEEVQEEATSASATVRPAVRFQRDPFEAAWHLLTSVRFAFFLIVGLAAASFAGALIIQVPGEISGNAAEYAQWVERVRPKFGMFTGIMSALGLFDVFRSLWFRVLVGTLSLSIIVCSLNRLPAIKRNILRPRVRLAAGFFRAVPFHAEVPAVRGDFETTAAAVAQALQSKGYRIVQERDGTVQHYYADRHRFSQLGTFALHLGLVLILAGALLGSLTGYRERDFTIPEGSVRPVGFGTDLMVKLESFADEYYPDGPPKDYRSELVLYQGTTEVRRQTVRVNEPLEYQGWRFHQAFFGPAAVLQVQDSSGRMIFNDGVALAWRASGDRPLGSFRVPEQNATVWVIGPAASGRSPWSYSAPDPLLKAGELRLEVYRGAEARPIAMETIQQGRPKTLAGLTFSFVRERQFSGLQVVNDPGAPVEYGAWMLATLGLILVFYFPYRRLWARCQQEADGTCRVYLGTTGRRELGLSREFAAVEHAVRARLNLVQGRASRV